MNKEPILLIMAAGMGSRFGGLKQMTPIGPAGEAILDYSIFDAKRAGFKRVVFLIKHQIEEDFRRIIGSRIEPHMEVRYAFQELDKIPAPYTVPEGRTKPWGTGHAVLCAAEYLDAPFAAINADDYYGVSAFRQAYDTLVNLRDDEKKHFMMVGYQLKNTVTVNGYVSRGVCTVQDGLLQDIFERTHIITSSDGPLYTDDGTHYIRLDPDTVVSMNLWGFTGGMLQALKEKFPAFLDKAMAGNPMKGEYFLPFVVNELLQSGEADARVLVSEDKWHGVTYQEDKADVVAAVQSMTDSGLYPTPLWG